MISNIKNIKNNPIIRDSVSLMLGSAISQLLPIIFSPFLSRIYNPVDFGYLAMFMALSAVLGMASSGLYEYAIILPKEDRKAVNIVFLISLISIFFAIGCFLILLLLKNFFPIDDYYFLLPFSVPCSVSFNILNYWFNRFKEYKKLNFLRIVQAFIIISISFLLYKLQYGLIYGFLSGGLFSLLIFIVIFFRKFHFFNSKLIINLATEYKKFPTLVLPTSLMNTVSSYSPVFFIKKGYTSSQLGSYSMSARVLTGPASIISLAIGQVFFKNLSDFYNNNQPEEVKKLFYNNSKILLLLAIFIFTPLFFFGEILITILLGSAWHQAGEYIQILSLASIVKFVASPLSTILIVKKNYKIVARWQTLYFITTLLLFSIFINFNIETLLWAYVFHETVLYLLYYILMRGVVEV